MYILGCLGSKHSLFDSLVIGAEVSIHFIEVHGRAGNELNAQVDPNEE